MLMENFSFDKNNNECIIFAKGEIDLSNSQDLRKMVLAALKTDDKVSVNLQEVNYIDSSGIASLVEGLQFSKSRNKEFYLLNPSKQVSAILNLARLDQVFTILEEDERID